MINILINLCWSRPSHQKLYCLCSSYSLQGYCIYFCLDLLCSFSWILLGLGLDAHKFGVLGCDLFWVWSRIFILMVYNSCHLLRGWMVDSISMLLGLHRGMWCFWGFRLLLFTFGFRQSMMYHLNMFNLHSRACG